MSSNESERVGIPQSATALERVLETMTQLMHQNATMLQSQAAVDLTKSIGDFSGRETPVEAKRWLKQIETSAFIHQWTEQFR